MSMCQSADAAWGFILGGDEDEWHCDSEKFKALEKDDQDLEKLFGFTEEPPWRVKALSTGEENDAWRARREAAIPAVLHWYGHIDYPGSLLVLRRRAHVDWGVGALGQEALPPPSEAELAALRKVLDTVTYTGCPEPRLLLWASYG